MQIVPVDFRGYRLRSLACILVLVEHVLGF